MMRSENMTNQIFSLKFILQNKITKVKMINMPVGHYLELEYDNKGNYIPPAKWVIRDIYYNLPLRPDTIATDLECFSLFDETFGDYLLSEVYYMINKLKPSK